MRGRGFGHERNAEGEALWVDSWLSTATQGVP